jgi:hypothetical protein
MDTTPNLSLPLVAAQQAQKHVTVNEALALLDGLAQISLSSRSITTPPPSPAEGGRWLVPAGATGAWLSQSGKIALFSGGVWSFLAPKGGWAAFVEDETRAILFNGTAWINFPATFPGTVPTLGVNATADATNRLSVAADASLLNHNGNGHQLKINKASAGQTATLLFQSGFSGRAEIGLAGNDSLSFKVSPDGATWKSALTINPSTGAVSLPNTPRVESRQLLHIVKGDAFTTTSSTPVAVPGLSLSLTPTGPCRIRLSGSVMLGADFWTTQPQLSIYRNGTKIWPAIATSFVEHQLVGGTASYSGYNGFIAPILAIDPLGTTDPVTYELRLSSRTSGSLAYINRRHLDATVRGESIFMVEELSP